MNLLDKIYESLEFKEFSNVINNIYLGKKIVSYEKFKKLVISFGLKIMKTYLEINNFKDEMYSFSIEKCSYNSGSYYAEINEIIISDSEIKKLYNGDLLNLLIVFHELSHFKINCDLIKENYSFDLIKVLKEKILANNIDFYYTKNYSLFSEEVYADLLSVKSLIEFLDQANIKLSRLDYEVLEKYLKKLKEDYQNNMRDFTHTLKIKNDYLTYEEVFDMYISKNPIALCDYPILNIEYYYEDVVVIKRTIEELVSLYNEEQDLDKKQLIKGIIVNNSLGILKEIVKRK